MTGNLDEKAVKEALKKIIDNNNIIPDKAKAEIKAIMELEHNPEKLLQERLLYMLSYQGYSVLKEVVGDNEKYENRCQWNRNIIQIVNLSNSIGFSD